MTRILPVVEGDGDLRAVPALIRRIAHEHGHFDTEVLPAHVRGDLPKVRSNFERFYRTALLEEASVLWVLDHDCEGCDDVEADLADLRLRATAVGIRQATEFALLRKEYETLFLADHESTRAFFPQIPASTAFPVDPEVVRDAKGWISKAQPKGLAYKPTTHQEKLTHRLDFLRLRQRSPSFCRFEAAVLTLLTIHERPAS